MENDANGSRFWYAKSAAQAALDIEPIRGVNLPMTKPFCHTARPDGELQKEQANKREQHDNKQGKFHMRAYRGRCYDRINKAEAHRVNRNQTGGGQPDSERQDRSGKGNRLHDPFRQSSAKYCG